MKFTEVDGASGPQVADLSGLLKDMKLTTWSAITTKVSDLSPLKDMKLTFLSCYNTQVSDLSPLKDMKLTWLHLGSTKVSDLSPLKDMKLTRRCPAPTHAGVGLIAAEGHEADVPELRAHAGGRPVATEGHEADVS